VRIGERAAIKGLRFAASATMVLQVGNANSRA
jgi:hypothetical protein